MEAPSPQSKPLRLTIFSCIKARHSLSWSWRWQRRLTQCDPETRIRGSSWIVSHKRWRFGSGSQRVLSLWPTTVSGRLPSAVGLGSGNSAKLANVCDRRGETACQQKECRDRLERAQTGLRTRKNGINKDIARYLSIGHAGHRFTDLEDHSASARR